MDAQGHLQKGNHFLFLEILPSALAYAHFLSLPGRDSYTMKTGPEVSEKGGCFKAYVKRFAGE